MNGQTDWLSAIGILLAGLVLGFMFVYAYVMKRRGQQPVVEDVVLRDLEAKRDALLQQLRDLDANEKDERARLGHVTPPRWPRGRSGGGRRSGSSLAGAVAGGVPVGADGVPSAAGVPGAGRITTFVGRSGSSSGPLSPQPASVEMTMMAAPSGFQDPGTCVPARSPRVGPAIVLGPEHGALPAL